MFRFALPTANHVFSPGHQKATIKIFDGGASASFVDVPVVQSTALR